MAGPRRSSRLSTQKTTVPPPSPRAQQKRKRDAMADGKATGPAPTTPIKRRTRPPGAGHPSLTTTPIAAQATGSLADDSRKARNGTVTRLADPRLSNATLLSPETSRLVASREVEFVSPSKLPAGRTTTQNLLQEACEHLIRVDERMKRLVEKNPCRIFSPEGLAERVDPFESLASGIISQQVSGAAAKSIKAKFTALFSDEESSVNFPHPSQVSKLSLEKLRTAGLSQRKAEYIQGLAEKFANGELSAHMLHEAPYEEILEKLIAVRGLGKWSVEMFAVFGLKRMDVFSVGDLGVQRGMAAFVGKDVAKLKSKGGKWKYMSEQDMLELSAKFAPYRSLFMWLMWRVEDSVTDVSTLE
ncbi:hypothetical protein DCS_01591 [Drechmeria coniospora]|uniref:HhH-GPD domain-containing protein n=1 Tax=Drechmeria coniospora TaxID=98403 RepID=A0A151GTK5_DRECN|nr:hypothetical protein DCS_01591 [Drechmeria coniospora]KYK60454.1 hypothetical protein DCS_01591 [Drechmeria coniospora]